MAVGQNQWYHFGVGEFTTHFRTYFSGDWDVHWGITGLLTQPYETFHTSRTIWDPTSRAPGGRTFFVAGGPRLRELPLGAASAPGHGSALPRRRLAGLRASLAGSGRSGSGKDKSWEACALGAWVPESFGAIWNYPGEGGGGTQFSKG